MLESYLIKGLLVGLVFGVPAGAVGALTIQRALAHGFWAGFSTGLGSSAADLLYACVGVFGITIVSDFLLAHQMPICLVGGAFIILLGIFIFRKQATKVEDTESRVYLPLYFGSSFVVAITNPATILAFFVAFSSFGIAARSTVSQAVQLILGILLGTCLWWGLLSGGVALFRKRITSSIYKKMNWVLGTLMVVFGVAVGVRACLAG